MHVCKIKLKTGMAKILISFELDMNPDSCYTGHIECHIRCYLSILVASHWSQKHIRKITVEPVFGDLFWKDTHLKKWVRPMTPICFAPGTPRVQDLRALYQHGSSCSQNLVYCPISRTLFHFQDGLGFKIFRFNLDSKL